jgi:PAS domain-containing protein
MPSPPGTLILDSKGRVSFCSDCLARMAGYSVNELVGRNVRSFMPALPLYPDAEGGNIAFGTFASAKQCRQSWTLMRREGGTLEIEGYFAMLKMQSGYVFCLELHYPGDCAIAPMKRPNAVVRRHKARNGVDAQLMQNE